jgi:chromosome segregation ATPase
MLTEMRYALPPLPDGLSVLTSVLFSSKFSSVRGSSTSITDSESILTTVEDDIASLRLHVEKVDRKRLAAEKSCEARSKRIEDLEERVREKDIEIQELARAKDNELQG